MMKKPNFSEAQLQQIVNTEITMWLYSQYCSCMQRVPHPIVINSIKEGEYGWDSAFYLPWLLAKPNNEGVNFFIQYKISNLIEGKNAREYRWWRESYFRFKLFYYSRDKLSGKSVEDFSQYNALKSLANEGFLVYYATNHVIDINKLFNLAFQRILLGEIPFLDLTSIKNYHKKVTFTQSSKCFLLHSKLEEQTKANWKNILSRVHEVKKTNLLEDIKTLKKFIINMENKWKKGSKKYFQEELEKNIEELKEKDKIYFEIFLIAKYLKLYFNCYWYRF